MRRRRLLSPTTPKIRTEAGVARRPPFPSKQLLLPGSVPNRNHVLRDRANPRPGPSGPTSSWRRRERCTSPTNDRYRRNTFRSRPGSDPSSWHPGQPPSHDRSCRPSGSLSSCTPLCRSSPSYRTKSPHPQSLPESPTLTCAFIFAPKLYYLRLKHTSISDLQKIL